MTWTRHRRAARRFVTPRKFEAPGPGEGIGKRFECFYFGLALKDFGMSRELGLQDVYFEFYRRVLGLEALNM